MALLLFTILHDYLVNGETKGQQLIMAQVDQQILDEEDGTLACGFVPSISQLRHPVEVGSFGVYVSFYIPLFPVELALTCFPDK